MGHGVCDHITKSSTLSMATNDLEIIKREILAISNKLNVPATDLRGIGIQISRLEKLSKVPLENILTKFFKPTDKIQNEESVTKCMIDTKDIKNTKETVDNNMKEYLNEPITIFKTAVNNRMTEISRNSPVSNVMQGMSKPESENKVSSRGRDTKSSTNQNISKSGKTRGRPRGSNNKNNRKINGINNGVNLRNFFNPINSEVKPTL